MIYPNIIYHPDTGTEIFIDSLQRVDHAADAEVVTYRSSVDGSLRSFTRDVGARQMSLSCKIRQENEQTMRRLLNYLRGEEVYLMIGAESMATAGRIQSFNIPKAVGTYTPLSIEFTCDTDLEGQFWDDMDEGGTLAADSAASGGKATLLDQYNEGAHAGIWQSDLVLPSGNYLMFCRARDINQVANDFQIYVYNDEDALTIASIDVTLTVSYAIYTLSFTVDSDDNSDYIGFCVSKNTPTVNNIYIDFLGFVKV